MDGTIKAIFFDIDGTLLSHKSNDVPPGTRRALARLRAQGIKTVVATGRHRIELDKLPVSDIKFDGYLTLNGDLMLDENKKAYAGTPIDKGEMEVLARIFSAREIPFVLIGENERYINFVNETVIKTQQATQGTVPEVGQWNGEDVYQIKEFMEQYGIERFEIMAFGDGENDIQMLKFAGIGVAMGNAADEVKEVADYVTDSVDENGIENALRHFQLID